jgi:hypothetical protein
MATAMATATATTATATAAVAATTKTAVAATAKVTGTHNNQKVTGTHNNKIIEAAEEMAAAATAFVKWTLGQQHQCNNHIGQRSSLQRRSRIRKNAQENVEW